MPPSESPTLAATSHIMRMELQKWGANRVSPGVGFVTTARKSSPAWTCGPSVA